MSKLVKFRKRFYGGDFIGEGGFGCVIDFEDFATIFENLGDTGELKEKNVITNFNIFPSVKNKKNDVKGHFSRLNSKNVGSIDLKYSNKVVKLLVDGEAYLEEIVSTELVKRLLGDSSLIMRTYFSFEMDLNSVDTKKAKKFVDSVSQCRNVQGIQFTPSSSQFSLEKSIDGSVQSADFFALMGGNTSRSGKQEMDKVTTFMKLIKKSNALFGDVNFLTLGKEKPENVLYCIVSEKGDPIKVKFIKDFKFVFQNLKKVNKFLIKLNQENFVHNDIKIENMLKTDDGIKVIDYGLIYDITKEANHNTTPLIRSPINILLLSYQDGIVKKGMNKKEMMKAMEDLFNILYYGFDIMMSRQELVESHEKSLKEELDVVLIEELEFLVEKFISYKNKEKFFKDHIHYFDFFSLGISLFRDLIKMTEKFPNKINKKGKMYPGLIDYIKKLVSIKYFYNITAFDKNVNKENAFKIIDCEYSKVLKLF